MWVGLVRLYRSNPIAYVYLLYGLIYEIENTELHVAMHHGNVVGCLLVWRGARTAAVHV